MVRTSVGYAGGTSAEPTYETVCAGDGHTEVVAIDFDPDVMPYERLLEVFFREHDPRERTKGQYRSVIFTTTPAQAAAAREAVARHGAYHPGRPIATLVAPAPAYWPAEDYHQQYVAKRRQRSGY